MAKTSYMSFRIDPDIKSDLEVIYGKYGLSITDAINIFLYTSHDVGGLPFDLRQGNELFDKNDAINKVRMSKGIIKDTGQTKHIIREERRTKYDSIN